MCNWRSNMRNLAVLLVVPLALSAQNGQVGAGVMVGPPTRNPNGGNGAVALPPTPPGDLCTLEGQVFDASTGQSLRKATISHPHPQETSAPWKARFLTRPPASRS